MAPARLRVATRGSALARWQTDSVAAAVRAAAPGTEVDVVLVETTGDRRRDVPIAEIGGRGVFVKEVQHAVLEGRAELAVHSAKDLPSQPADGLVIAAVPERGDPRDALVGATLDQLPAGATVATGSARRRAQLAWARPDLTFADLRGNIDTRLEKASGFGAIVVAVAALERLGRTDRIAQVLDPTLMLPQVAQGALAVECRADDAGTVALLRAIEHEPSRRCVDAERAFLAGIGGGCDLPVGAYATVAPDGAVDLTGLIAAGDGRTVLRWNERGDDPAALGALVAQSLLDDGGARSLLEDESGASADAQ